MQKFAAEYLPYLVANREAYKADAPRTLYTLGGLEWDVVTAPYRVYCLAQLQERYQALTEEDHNTCRDLLGDAAVDILAGEIFCPPAMQNVTAAEPAKLVEEGVVSRHWQPKSRFAKYLESSRAETPSQRKPEAKEVGSDWLPIYFKHHRAK
jgi:hypothetical protein